jgi:hypothetical protein
LLVLIFWKEDVKIAKVAEDMDTLKEKKGRNQGGERNI